MARFHAFRQRLITNPDRRHTLPCSGLLDTLLSQTEFPVMDLGIPCSLRREFAGITGRFLRYWSLHAGIFDGQNFCFSLLIHTKQGNTVIYDQPYFPQLRTSRKGNGETGPQSPASYQCNPLSPCPVEPGRRRTARFSGWTYSALRKAETRWRSGSPPN